TRDNIYVFFFSSRRRHTRSKRDWSSDVCSSDLQCYGLTSFGCGAILKFILLCYQRSVYILRLSQHLLVNVCSVIKVWYGQQQVSHSLVSWFGFTISSQWVMVH